jgi:hypothetical protein
MHMVIGIAVMLMVLGAIKKQVNRRHSRPPASNPTINLKLDLLWKTVEQNRSRKII